MAGGFDSQSLLTAADGSVLCSSSVGAGTVQAAKAATAVAAKAAADAVGRERLVEVKRLHYRALCAANLMRREAVEEMAMRSLEAYVALFERYPVQALPAEAPPRLPEDELEEDDGSGDGEDASFQIMPDGEEEARRARFAASDSEGEEGALVGGVVDVDRAEELAGAAGRKSSWAEAEAGGYFLRDGAAPREQAPALLQPLLGRFGEAL